MPALLTAKAMEALYSVPVGFSFVSSDCGNIVADGRGSELLPVVIIELSASLPAVIAAVIM
jgi:hypothetical protein